MHGTHSSLKLGEEDGNKYVQFAKVVDDTCHLPKRKLKGGGNLSLRLSPKETPREASTVSDFSLLLKFKGCNFNKAT